MGFYLLVDGIPVSYSVDGKEPTYYYKLKMTKSSICFVPVTISSEYLMDTQVHTITMLIDQHSNSDYRDDNMFAWYIPELNIPITLIDSPNFKGVYDTQYTEIPFSNLDANYTDGNNNINTSICMDSKGNTHQAVQQPYIENNPSGEYELTAMINSPGTYVVSLLMEEKPIGFSNGEKYLLWNIENCTAI